MLTVALGGEPVAVGLAQADPLLGLFQRQQTLSTFKGSGVGGIQP